MWHRARSRSETTNSYRRLHLTKQVQIAAANGQHLFASLQVDLRGFVEAARDMADRAQVDNHGAVHLRKLRSVELRSQLFQRRADHRLARLASVAAPGDQRVFLIGTEEVYFVD